MRHKKITIKFKNKQTNCKKYITERMLQFGIKNNDKTYSVLYPTNSHIALLSQSPAIDNQSQSKNKSAVYLKKNYIDKNILIG